MQSLGNSNSFAPLDLQQLPICHPNRRRHSPETQSHYDKCGMLKPYKGPTSLLLLGTSISDPFSATSSIFHIETKFSLHPSVLLLKILRAGVRNGDCGDALLSARILELEKVLWGLFLVFFYPLQFHLPNYLGRVKWKFREVRSDL